MMRRCFSSRRGRWRNGGGDEENALVDSEFGKKTMNKVNALLAAHREKSYGPRIPSAKETMRFQKAMAKKQERKLSSAYLAQPIFRPGSPARELFGNKTMLNYEDKVPETVFPGTIHVISTLEEEMMLRPTLEAMKIVGVDCEMKPNMFRSFASGPIALVQLASHDVSILYRVRWDGTWNPTLTFPGLSHVMAASNVVKVGHGCDLDFKGMQQCGLATNITSTVDTLPVASKVGCLKPNLRAMGMVWRSVQVSKAMQTSDWEAAVLSPEQVQYAATDAWLARQGWSILHAALESSL
ncbi:unnamed protein product [Aphanomyces euteiches]